jgi:hypothetical protein
VLLSEDFLKTIKGTSISKQTCPELAEHSREQKPVHLPDSVNGIPEALSSFLQDLNSRLVTPDEVIQSG